MVDGSQSSAPTVANGILWLHADSTLKALDANTGEILWAATAPRPLIGTGTPIVAEGHVYSVSSDGHLVAFGLP